jgi:hypothetical protein
MRQDFRAWLDLQDYGQNTINSQCSLASRVEQAYGSLDDHYATDRLEGVLRSLQYSAADNRRGLPNPSKITVGGDIHNGLASLRSAVGLYRRFRDAAGPHEPASSGLPARQSEKPASNGDSGRIGFERDLQRALRRRIDQLEPGLTIVDEGVERAVSSGYIDITARDAKGAFVVIELKAATADRSAIGQILSYMGDVAEEEGESVRGILVAHDFDQKTRAAARMVPKLVLRSYAVNFTFEEVDG